jgi:hypothetical protein
VLQLAKDRRLSRRGRVHGSDLAPGGSGQNQVGSGSAVGPLQGLSLQPGPGRGYLIG